MSLKKSFRLFLLAILVTVALAFATSIACFAADDSGEPGPKGHSAQYTTVAAHTPGDIVAPEVTAATQQLPSFQLPAQKDATSILTWIFAVLLPWAGWVLSELMALIPGFKGNGVLHSLVEGLKALSSDGSGRKVTVDLDQLAAAVKGKLEEPGAGA